MDSFDKTNLQNIKNIFEEKTGVELDVRQHRGYSMKTAMIAAVILVCGFTVTAFAFGIFSSLSGDELSLCATYEGNGIVSVQVENKSDKALSFQKQLKLMLWSDGKEIEPISDMVIFDGTDFEAHTNGVMTIDISKAYDIDFLEQPLTDDHYYFVLTNNNFMFGQDWMCSVYFAEPIEAGADAIGQITSVEADEELAKKVIEQLQPYFEYNITDPAERNRIAFEYLEKCGELLDDLCCDVAASESPMLLVERMNPSIVFDDSVPKENQYCLVGQNWHTLDGFGIPVGSTDVESALVLSAYVPEHKGETDGGVDIPLIYIFTYDLNDTADPTNYAFIHGQLLTFEEMAEYKVYEDEQYACYEVTDLFYSDLRKYVERIVSQRSDIYFDEQVWNRVRNIYNYYTDKEELGSRFFYKDITG